MVFWFFPIKVELYIIIWYTGCKGVVYRMEELIKLLDESLEYIEHEIKDNEIHIRVKSKKREATCPYCGYLSTSVHSKNKNRTLKDLPIQGKKVKLILETNKYFCKNPECDLIAFVERFSFFEPSATKTNRLQDEILRISLNQSSVAASRYLRKSVADVGKSTICNLLKKGHVKCGFLNGNNKNMH